MMKPNKFVALICFAFLSLCEAMAAKVTVDWDTAADFAKYRTYAWSKGTPATNPLMDRQIIAAVDSELAAKGFQKVDSPDSADLVVIYHAAVGTETELNTTSMGSDWGWRWGGRAATTTVDKIPNGQLVVDIGDAQSKKLLWMGNASDTLSDKPEKNVDKLEKAVTEMFKKFPPPKKK